MPTPPEPPMRPPAPSAAPRWLPLAVIVAVAALVFAMGWHRLLSLKVIGLNYDHLRHYIEANVALSLAVYAALYVSVVALSLPGAAAMTLAGGLLFGWQLGAPVTIVAATIGGTILFLVARSSFGEALAARAGPAVAKLRAGFQADALNYMLFLRLVPLFPFFVVNLAAAVLSVPLVTFVVGTFIGIIPGTTAYAVAGAGLGSVIRAQNAGYAECLAKPGASEASCPYTVDTSRLVTPELIAAFAMLGLVALIPVVLKKWRERNAAA